ncbi:hypothetical protein BC2230_11654 [Burkholderia cepacia]
MRVSLRCVLNLIFMIYSTVASTFYLLGSNWGFIGVCFAYL